ncbi:hypothetical protein JTB14_010109 [Gonioctena quinquepunctata]|nr:hypothetical protein JTB14_010109 [Gonioctena quinquepunctata]
MYDPNSSQFEVIPRDIVEDPIESKFSPAHFYENKDFNGLAGEVAKPKVNHFDNGVIIKNEDEDHSKCTEDLSANSAELKTETFKTEYDIDFSYEDVKPQICEGKSSGKNEKESYQSYVTDKLTGTEIGPNFSLELSKDAESWPQQKTEENGTVIQTFLQLNSGKPTISIMKKLF